MIVGAGVTQPPAQHHTQSNWYAAMIRTENTGAFIYRLSVTAATKTYISKSCGSIHKRNKTPDFAMRFLKPEVIFTPRMKSQWNMFEDCSGATTDVCCFCLVAFGNQHSYFSFVFVLTNENIILIFSFKKRKSKLSLICWIRCIFTVHPNQIKNNDAHGGGEWKHIATTMAMVEKECCKNGRYVSEDQTDCVAHTKQIRWSMLSARAHKTESNKSRLDENVRWSTHRIQNASPCLHCAYAICVWL